MKDYLNLNAKCKIQIANCEMPGILAGIYILHFTIFIFHWIFCYFGTT